jgi:hypothetical protein
MRRVEAVAEVTGKSKCTEVVSALEISGLAAFSGLAAMQTVSDFVANLATTRHTTLTTARLIVNATYSQKYTTETTKRLKSERSILDLDVLFFILALIYYSHLKHVLLEI